MIDEEEYLRGKECLCQYCLKASANPVCQNCFIVISKLDKFLESENGRTYLQKILNEWKK